MEGRFGAKVEETPRVKKTLSAEGEFSTEKAAPMTRLFIAEIVLQLIHREAENELEITARLTSDSRFTEVGFVGTWGELMAANSCWTVADTTI